MTPVNKHLYLPQAPSALFSRNVKMTPHIYALRAFIHYSSLLDTNFRLWAGIVGNVDRDIIRVSKRVVVEVGGFKDGVTLNVEVDLAVAPLELDPICLDTSLRAGDNWVEDILEVARLDEELGIAPSVVAVARDITVVVVIQVAVLDVVGAGVAHVGRVEEVVVDGDLCNHVISPADAEGLVVVLDSIVGHRYVVSVAA